MKTKVSLIIGLILLWACGARAQVAVVSGNLKDLGVNNATSKNSFVQFTLSNFGSNIPRVIGTNAIVSAQSPKFVPDGSGNISGNIQKNNSIKPDGTFYRVCIFYQGTQFQCNSFLINADFNLNSALPITTTPVVPAPTGDTTYARLDGLNQPFTGPVTVPNLTDSALVSGRCVQASTAGLLGTTTSPCVTLTGSPASGNLASFSGAGSITNGNLSGDVSTAGTLVATLATVATPGTNTKITFNAKGLVTSSAAAQLASADFANQGTTTTVLHGNAAGNPSFGQVLLSAEVTGTLPGANYAQVNLAGTGNGGVGGNLPAANVAPGSNGQCLKTTGGVSAWGTCTAPVIQVATKTPGCTTANPPGSICTDTLTWPVAFANASYVAVCSGTNVPQGVPGVNAVQNYQTTTIDVITTNINQGNVAGQYASISCIGIHP